MPTPKVDTNRLAVVTVDGAVKYGDELVAESLQEGGGGMKAFVVLNRTSGQEAHERVRGALDSHFGASRIQYEVHETRKGEKLGEIVRGRMRHGFDLAVAAGGDGTVSAVIDGIAGNPDPTRYYPYGDGESDRTRTLYSRGG